MIENNGLHADRPSLDEQLVAYLDGELDGDARNELERFLAEDADVRDRLRGLQESWDLLNQLPCASTHDSFTQTTVEMVAVKASEDMQASRDASRTFRLRRVGPGIVVLMVSFGLGYLIFAALAGARQDRHLHDLALIEKSELYAHADGLTFLRALADEVVFGEELVEQSTVGSEKLLFDGLDITQMRQRASILSASEKRKLRRQRERFDRRESTVKNQIRHIHQQLSADDNRQQLTGVLTKYYEWRKTLSPEERAEIDKLPGGDRIAKIVEIKGQQERMRVQDLVMMDASPQTIRDVSRWFREYVRKHEQEITDSLSDEAASALGRPNSPERYFRLMRFVTKQGDPDLLPELRPDELADLMKQLPEQLRNELQSAESAGRQWELVRLVLAAAASQMRLQISDEELQEFFAELPPIRQAELKDLPPDQFRVELRHEFFKRQFGRHRFQRGPPGRSPRGDFDPKRGQRRRRDRRPPWEDDERQRLRNDPEQPSGDKRRPM